MPTAETGAPTSGLRSLRTRLLDRMVPPLPIEARGGPAYFAYDYHKSALVGGSYMCPLLDPLIRARGERIYTYVTIGELPGAETVESAHVPRRLNWLELLCSLFFVERGDFADLRFLLMLYDAPELCRLRRGGRWHEVRPFRWLLALRGFLVARYFCMKFRLVAANCDSAHVLVYYNAVMLGVTRAFRRLGKPVWDVQHGYLGPNHDAYNNPRAFAIDSGFRPSAFLVWDSHFGEYLERTLGAKWESTDFMHLRAFGRVRRHDRSRRSILYSLQWGTPVPDDVFEAVRRFPQIDWLFRMHPCETSSRADLDALRGLSNATIVDADRPLSLALADCDVHVTFNSGVVHEAAALGIPSLVLDGTFAARIAREADAGLAYCVDKGDLVAALDRTLTATNSVPGCRP
jgi:hypothetical protein